MGYLKKNGKNVHVFENVSQQQVTGGACIHVSFNDVEWSQPQFPALYKYCTPSTEKCIYSSHFNINKDLPWLRINTSFSRSNTLRAMSLWRS